MFLCHLQEARTLLLIAEANGKAGDFPIEQSGISVSRKGIQVSAFRHNSPDNPVFAKPTADSQSALLRLWEQGGISGNVAVTFPKGSVYTKATPVNLRGEVTGKSINIKGDELIFLLNAYTPVSFVLE